MTQDLNLVGLTDAQVLAMVDGLVAAGNYGLAARICETGAAKADEGWLKRRLRWRRSLLVQPTGTTQALFRVAREVEQIEPTAFVGDGLATWMKAGPFQDDPRFMDLVDKHSRLLPLKNWHWNLQTVLWAAVQTRAIPGDFVELGVFRGHTTLFVAEYLGFERWSKRWWLYDTFEGIPVDQQDPGWGELNEKAYGFLRPYEEVRERFSPYPNIEVIQGRVPEILAEKSPETIAFIHMDLNSSTAEIAALDALHDRLSPGGIIVFDDYCWGNARAQYLAERRWFADRGEHILPMPTGQGVYVRR